MPTEQSFGSLAAMLRKLTELLGKDYEVKVRYTMIRFGPESGPHMGYVLTW